MSSVIANFKDQVSRNWVAYISLFVAIFALAYNTWRNERTEEQRNIRQAAFQIIESLGEMQEIVDERYYYLPFDEGRSAEPQLRLRGYGNLAMSHDLMSLLPPPAPMAGDHLYATWLEHFDELADLDHNGDHSEQAQQAEESIRLALINSREAVLETLRMLD